ncbi:peptidyl-prolyl cis-trans isomerase [Aspergillus heteromorphus CBS 117.55]|uniref:Enhancer of mRNA-decapping protein 3 n=1 Tax=Aspergillus heteromorphus CBS 117.55 TaxID=1448321 RepID=A0A317UZT1_9EURO|nr:peptidyl-prolyl cis-trans isomerase [Aspergillus heteromorphus CBS 117.55]PWY66067.1 peptidyl-prolyl cis-trans isomerase [Aspergillus heteromorphus CBS 117.55]
MASEFIGYNVLVTLRAPPNATVQGEVANVVGQRLMLRNVTLSWLGHQLPTYFLEAPDIADLSLGPVQPPAQHPPPTQEPRLVPQGQPAPPAPPAPPQPFVDPAILSFSKPPVVPPSQLSEPPQLPPPSISRAPSQNPQFAPQAHRDQAAVLNEPFSNIQELDVGKNTVETRNPVPTGPVSSARGAVVTSQVTSQYGVKANRRGGQPKTPKTFNEHDGATNTDPKSKGWRQTAFVEPSYPHLAKSLNKPRRKKNNRANYAEDANGWATEDATDIQELGEFDFQSNLSKFDKRKVFEEIRNDDTTADEDRLVSFNRRQPKPGTNGGKNLHWTENVLDSPESESETDRVPSDAKLSSGTYSGRERSKASRASSSRKGSTILGQPLPRPNKTSVTASPISGSGAAGATFRLTTTNRSCPTVSPLQTIEVEQIAVAELGLTEDMIAENTGRGIAEAAVGLLSSDEAAPTMLVLTGNHRSGARAIAAARHLRNRGHRVTVCMLGMEHDTELLESCRKQLDVFKKIGGRVHRWEDLSTRLATSEFSPDLVVDALFGIHIAFDDLRTDDQATAFEMISWANRSNLTILSVDVPSGVSAISGDVTTVEGGRLCVNAKSVVCLGAPKTGILNALLSGEGLHWNLTVADIGIPQIVWRKYGSRRRHGIDFGNRWVVPLRYQPLPVTRYGNTSSFITHSEWASDNAFSASAGAGIGRSKRGGVDNTFKRLPFNFCSLSLQPFSHPVCTPTGTIFDLTNILPWIKKHGTNPVDGAPLKGSDLIKLTLAKNESGEYVDPVTYKVFTDNTHIVALRNTGNVFAWDTVDRLNIKGKLWRDLVTDEEFSRKDIITLQDPQNIESRNLSSFNYLKEGETGLTDEQIRERDDPANNVNASALGSSAKILKAREAVAKARADRAQRSATPKDLAKAGGAGPASLQVKKTGTSLQSGKPVPYNAAKYTTGLAAASFTSTGITPHTSAELALLSDEDYMLKRGRVKQKGYARISTSAGDVNLELHTEYAPRAVWNFIKLAKKGYYRDVAFHRNIRGFMIQGGDPSGTGRGGESIWGKYFNDEFDGPLKHDSRGTLSMANKGKNTNSSQFFIAYRALPHLNNKHTIFGHVIDDPTPSSTTLNNLETHPTNPTTNRPTPDVRILDVTVFVDPFEEFLRQKQADDLKAKGLVVNAEEEDEKARRAEDDRMTWTGKRVRGSGPPKDEGGSGGVGKYLKAALAERDAAGGEEDEIVEFVDEEPEPEPMRKKSKGGGFGDFSSWD